MPTLTEQRKQLLGKAQAVVDRAKSTGRDFTASEETEVQGVFSDIQSLDVKIQAAKKSDDLMAQIAGLGSGSGEDDDPASAGLQFTAEQKAGLVHAFRTKGAYATQVRRKAPTTVGTLLPASGIGVAAQPTPGGVVELRGLFTQQQADGPTVRYYTMTSGTAAVVAEGALKPDAGIVTTPVDRALTKLANTFKVSDELGEDAPYLARSIQDQAMRALFSAENTHIIGALNAASGIMVATGTQAAALDALAAAIGAAESANGATPRAVVASPVDVAKLRQLKAATAGSYLLGDPLGSAPSAVWGVPLVSSPSATAGQLWLLGDGAGVFYSRGTGVRVEVGYEMDDFTKNLVTTRVEERVLCAITAPTRVTKLTLT